MKFIYIPTLAFTYKILHRCTHRHIQSTYVFSHVFLLFLTALSEREQGPSACALEEFSALDGKPSAKELCRPIPLKLRGKLVAAKCSFISRGSGHRAHLSLGKYPQCSCGPQSDYLLLWPQRQTRMRVLEQDIFLPGNFFLIIGNTWTKVFPWSYWWQILSIRGSYYFTKA